MSFVQSLQKSNRRANTYFVTGKKGSLPYWHFLEVPPTKQKQFERSIKQKEVVLTEFGTILASGWGDIPPRAVLDEYGAELDLS